MKPDALTDTGHMLFGAGWKAAMAVALGVHVRTVQRWATGERDIPSSIAQEIREMADDHARRRAKRAS